VDLLGQKALACTGLPGDQQRGVVGDHAFYGVKQRPHLDAGSQHAAEGVVLAQRHLHPLPERLED